MHPNVDNDLMTRLRREKRNKERAEAEEKKTELNRQKEE